MARCGTWEKAVAQHVYDGLRQAGLSVVMTPAVEDADGGVTLGITHGKRGNFNGGKVLLEIFSENLGRDASVLFFDDPTDFNYSSPEHFYGECANAATQFGGKPSDRTCCQ